jgi:ABC-type transporter Mla subunit MlaD
MNSDSKFFKLGIFVIVGVALVVGGVVVLGAGELFTPYVTVETATTESVEGLDVGAAVKYSGVTVGKVSKIEMAMWKYPSADPAVMSQVRRYVWIQLSVRRDLLPAKSDEEMHQNFDTAVKNGLRVRMASSGLTGPAFLDISFLDPKQYPAAKLPWTPEQMCIPAAPAAMAQIVTNINSILTELHGAELGETLADSRKFFTDTDAAVDTLQVKDLQTKATALLDEANATTDQLHRLLDDPNLKQAITSLPKVTGPLIASLNRIDAIVNDPKMQKMIDDLSATTASAAPSAQDLRRALRTLNEVLDSRQRDLETIITDLRQILQSGDAIIQDAKANPSRMILGNPPPHLQESDKK